MTKRKLKQNAEKILAPLDEHGAAEFLGVSVQKVRQWRYRRKEGPVFLRLGKSIRYLQSDLEDFRNRNRVDPTKAAEVQHP